MPPQRIRDREYQATKPGFEFQELPNDTPYLRRIHGSQTPLPENGFLGNNRSRYMNPEFDALIDRYMATIKANDRLPLMGQILQLSTEQLNLMPLWYNVRPNAVGKQLRNIAWQQVTGGNMEWNASEWEVVG